MADLALGLATAPVLFASQEFPELEPLILRKFSSPGDVETAWTLVTKSEGLERTRELAEVYRAAAEESLSVLSDSQYKQSLIQIAEEVVSRDK